MPNSSQYGKAHIPNAQLLNWNEIVAERNNIPNEMPPLEDIVVLLRKLGIDEEDQIVIYDNEGGIPAARAYMMFDYVDANDHVIAYCRTGGQAAHAYFTLKYLGYDVAVYDGSYIEWQQAEDTNVVK